MTLQQKRASMARELQLTARRTRQVDGCVWSDGNRVVNTRPSVNVAQRVRNTCALAKLFV